MTQTNQGRNGQTLSLDGCLELLADRQRRVVLRFFLESDAAHASVDDLVSEIVEEEASVTGERPGRDSVSSVLYHPICRSSPTRASSSTTPATSKFATGAIRGSRRSMRRFGSSSEGRIQGTRSAVSG